MKPECKKLKSTKYYNSDYKRMENADEIRNRRYNDYKLKNSDKRVYYNSSRRENKEKSRSLGDNIHLKGKWFVKGPIRYRGGYDNFKIKQMIPDRPAEPDPENIQSVMPKDIPLFGLVEKTRLFIILLKFNN